MYESFVSPVYSVPLRLCYCITVNFLNIRTPKTFVVITLKVEQDGISLE